MPRGGWSGFASFSPGTCRAPGWFPQWIKQPQIIPSIPKLPDSAPRIYSTFTLCQYIHQFHHQHLNLPFKSLLMWQRPKIDHYIWTQIIFIYLSNGMNSRGSCSSYMCPSHTQPSCSSTSHHAHRLGLTHFIFAQTVLPTTLPSLSVCNIQVYIRPLTAQTSQVRGYHTAQE